MKVCHAAWVPSGADGFNNDGFNNLGQFVFWVETASMSRAKKATDWHPFHITHPADLKACLSDLGLPKASVTSCGITSSAFYVSLPTHAGRPLFSIEMAQLTGDYPFDDVYEADQIAWQTWLLQGLAVADPLSFLRELQVATYFLSSEVRFGADLLFWIAYAKHLSHVVRQHQFMPTMQCQQPLTPKTKASVKPKASAKTKASENNVTLYAGWSPVGERLYEPGLRDFARAMPLVCQCYQPCTDVADSKPAGMGSNGWDAHSLLRHFSEVQVDNLVKKTPLTKKLLKQFEGSWLVDSFDFAPLQSSVEQWQQWHAWQQAIVNTQEDHHFVLGLRLHAVESVSESVTESTWWLGFFVASSRDPSLKIDMADWWALSEEEQHQWYQRFGGKFERHLLVNMGHAARMCPVLWQALDTSQPCGLGLDIDSAYAFLKQDALVLESAGFKVVVPSWWTPQGRKRAKLRVSASGRTTGQVDKDTGEGYFSLPDVVAYRYELAIGGEPVSEAEWQALVEAKTPLVQFRGEWMELDPAQMESLLALMQTQAQVATELSVNQLLKQWAEADEETTEFVFDDALDDMLMRLQQPRSTDLLDNPAGLQGQLRPYQQQGLSWLATQEALGLNPCLADDMGLGKTIQVIALLLHERAEGAQASSPRLPTLLIAPTSVLSNWQKEMQTFAPSLRSLIHHGSARHTDIADFKAQALAHDVVITSFTLARKDSELLKKMAWHRVVVDEAQNIKNPQSAQAKAIYALKAPHRIALTGTPIENRLMDMWSLFHFLNPGYLGTAIQFKRAYETPIQRDGSPQHAKQLQRLVQPFILRRLKTDKSIISDLPDKLEQKLYCNLTQEQATLYQAVVDEVKRKLEDAEGMARKGLILSTLMRLKQVCNHPAQFLQDGSAFSSARSHKLTRLNEMLEEALAGDDSVLVFTQFTEVGDQLAKTLREQHVCPVYYLHGGTSRKHREQMIERFQDPDSPPGIFILSLKAGGVGITLTRANHVFHFDRWWNPAVENQATDRAYRIGQQKTVFAHKMVTLGTLEERIDQMITDKQALADSIVGTDENWLTEMDNAAFAQLIELNRATIMEA
ncbi:DEAD/DEAH box helicase [Thiomicrospira microaerophila]|uniref:DEAD/DEAH box helicase n=1 Tax=Thiomicrospira microaerophila TaxID=406020 RepID=UPI0005CB7419|nr:DEAD/DEAH box helicase [Thiomicrospira microaerophila]